MALIVAVGAFVAAVKVLTPLVDHQGGFDSDGRFYAAMAGEGSLPRELATHAPWCWRVLTPWIVSLLPVPTLLGFTILALATTTTTLLLFYATLRRAGVGIVGASLGLTFYSGVFWSVRFAFYSPAYTDHVTQLLLVLVLYLSVVGRFWLLPLVMAVACLHKEVFVLLCLPAVFAYGRLRGFRRARTALYALALLLPSVAVVATLRAVIEPTNDYDPFAWLLHLRAALRPQFWPRFVLAILCGLGLLPAIVAWRAHAARRFISSAPVFAGLALLSVPLLFGGVDKARLFLYLLPAMAAAGGVVVEELLGERRGSVRWIWVAITVGAHAHVGGLFARLEGFEGYLAELVPMHAHATAIGPSLLKSLAVVAGWVAASALLLSSGRRERGREPKAGAEGRRRRRRR